MIKKAVGTKAKIDQFLYDLSILENDKQLLFRREENFNRRRKQLKEEIILQNSHLLGKVAHVINDHGQQVDAVCTKVDCNSDFTIKPLFSRNGKKCSVLTYEWL